jgi:hypothetical protein
MKKRPCDVARQQGRQAQRNWRGLSPGAGYTKLHGVSEHTLHLHLKEFAWRFGLRDCDVYTELRKLVRENPL